MCEPFGVLGVLFCQQMASNYNHWFCSFSINGIFFHAHLRLQV